jgi:hypothetical protein
MRRSHWTPSIVPRDDDRDVYLVVDDFGRSGRAFREADVETTDLETKRQLYAMLAEAVRNTG